MWSVESLPHLNAALNTLAACFLLAGFLFIRAGNKWAHQVSMFSAVGVSSLFLVSYVVLRMHAPIFEFQGQGTVRIVYFTILTSHVILALAIVPLVSITLFRAITGRFDKHRKIAKWTWPAWMYVSISGVVVYVMLYLIYTPPEFAGLR